jgi:hypothetical protein
MSAQRTPDRLLMSLHVSFGDDITHEIPALDMEEKAAMYYSRKDLKAFKIANKLRCQRKMAKLLKLMDAHNKSMVESVQAMEFPKVAGYYIAC